MRNLFILGCVATLASCTGGAEHTNAWVQEKSADQVTIGIHISLLSHPPETHALGYNKMQSLANDACAEFGKEAAEYTGQQEQKTRGNAYDTWLERTYRCV
ncbi:hypothetical protein J7399_10135 [Shimia sp. R9_1]|uniref:hypothetical protein n=1 Tax=Shimia sp. R9_1 TaxID=2821111 RepID=UPI001ADC520B|nr:hypothetical protein [Shimia sp. R9_1]MBO9407789.1 hypothetical protein [Shimia sp. R9_1]